MLLLAEALQARKENPLYFRVTPAVLIAGHFSVLPANCADPDVNQFQVFSSVSWSSGTFHEAISMDRKRAENATGIHVKESEPPAHATYTGFPNLLKSDLLRTIYI